MSEENQSGSATGSNQDELLDALIRVDRLLRDTVRLEKSPAAWCTIAPTTPGADEFEIVVNDDPPDRGPIWEGLPGEIPMLTVVRHAIDVRRQQLVAGKTVWIAGQAHLKPGEVPDGMTPYAWSLQGVFATEADAVAACRDHTMWFVGPAVVGECLPEENVLWHGAYYPNQRSAA